MTETEKLVEALKAARDYVTDHQGAQPNDETAADLARIDEALTAWNTRPDVVPEGVAREIAEALADHDADAADAAERGERSDGWVIEISPASARAILSLLSSQEG
jgi:hypothetical protein